MAAEAARHQLGLDRVLLVVANNPWQKSPHRTLSSAADRLAMVRAACKGRAGLEASSLEIDRGGPSYTIDTVRQLYELAARGGAPRPELALVIGADLVAELETWERWSELRDLVTLAIVPRQGMAGADPPPGSKVVRLADVDVDVSSSGVRDAIADGESIDGVVPEEVIRCIERLGLYAKGR